MENDLTVEQLLRERQQLQDQQRMSEIHLAYLKGERPLTGADAAFLYEQFEQLAGVFNTATSSKERLSRVQALLQLLGFLE